MAFLLRLMSRYNETDKEPTQDFGPRLTHLNFSPVQKWRRAQARRFFLCEATRQLGAGKFSIQLDGGDGGEEYQRGRSACRDVAASSC